jgi:low affinity Fe/Cu permease
MSMATPDWFTRFSSRIARVAGHPATFAVAAGSMLAWAAVGPFVGFSDVWQLTVNTGTTIVTFLMVFLIQSTQNRDTCAMQIKLDELIRATETAHNRLLDLEEHSGKELEEIRAGYIDLAGQEDAGQEDQEGAARGEAGRGEAGRGRPVGAASLAAAAPSPAPAG